MEKERISLKSVSKKEEIENAIRQFSKKRYNTLSGQIATDGYIIDAKGGSDNCLSIWVGNFKDNVLNVYEILNNCKYCTAENGPFIIDDYRKLVRICNISEEKLDDDEDDSLPQLIYKALNNLKEYDEEKTKIYMGTKVYNAFNRQIENTYINSPIDWPSSGNQTHFKGIEIVIVDSLDTPEPAVV